MKTNKKLALNKQIISNLNDIKGGEDGITGNWVCFVASILVCEPIGDFIKSKVLNAKQICLSDSCFSKQANCTQQAPGSCGKCQ